MLSKVFSTVSANPVTSLCENRRRVPPGSCPPYRSEESCCFGQLNASVTLNNAEQKLGGVDLKV
jgi:hypothetical protein